MKAAVFCGLLTTERIACDQRRTDAGAGTWEATGRGGPRRNPRGAEESGARADAPRAGHAGVTNERRSHDPNILDADNRARLTARGSHAQRELGALVARQWHRLRRDVHHRLPRLRRSAEDG